MPKNKGGNAKSKDKGAKGGDAGDDSGPKASKGGTAVKVSASFQILYFKHGRR